MNVQNVMLWVQALVSGKFAQCNGELQSNKAFCCLGIACIIAEENGISIKRTETESTHAVLYGSNLSDTQKSVMEWLDITMVQQDRYISLNDSCGLTFEQIAEVVKMDAGLPSRVLKNYIQICSALMTGEEMMYMKGDTPHIGVITNLNRTEHGNILVTYRLKNGITDRFQFDI